MKQLCPLCFQDIMIHQDFFHWLKQDALICGDCRKQLIEVNTDRKLEDINIHILYEYNDFLENLLFQYKEGLDVVLAPVFFHEFIKELKQRYRGYTILMMPSSIEKLQERGFLPLEDMLKELDLPKISPFYKTENRKQSTLSYEDRQLISNIICLKQDVKLPKRKVLLVDDVCTTGATLKAAYHLIKSHTISVEACVLCANPRFLYDSSHRPNALIHKIKGRIGKHEG